MPIKYVDREYKVGQRYLVDEPLAKHYGKIVTISRIKDDYFSREWKVETYEIEEHEEMVFKGLGWITVKRGPLKVEVHLPKDAEIIIRDAFVEPKRVSMEQDYD